MKITITINCDNAAFEDDATAEILRILTSDSTRKKIEDVTTTLMRAAVVLDSNGNRVGSIQRTGKVNRHPEVGSV